MGTFQSFKTLKRSFSLLDTKTITKDAKMQLRLRFFNIMWAYTPSIARKL